MNLENKVAIVTGGATGIGREIVKKLAHLGAIVVVNYNKSIESSQKLIDELTMQGLKVDHVQANIAKFDEVQKLIDFTIDKYKTIDILVNNAGITADGLIMRMSEEDFDKVIEVNLKGTWNTCKLASRVMSKNKTGKIVNITSVVGLIGNAGQTNYAASKAGVIGLTKSLARELAKRNICVNAVAPGFIKTKMTENLPEEIVNYYLNNIPIGRLGEAEEVSNLVAFLCSDLSNYITGQVMNVDGGLVMY